MITQWSVCFKNGYLLAVAHPFLHKILLILGDKYFFGSIKRKELRIIILDRLHAKIILLQSSNNQNSCF